MKLAIDAMGGDRAPETNLGGLRAAMADYPDIERFLIVGDSEVLRAELPRCGINAADPRLELVHASQVIDMGDPPSTALRAKRDSSMTVAAGLIKEGRADAVVSAGNTGAAVATMVVKNRMLPGVDRPGIAAVFPAEKGNFVMIDVGANVECKPLHLAQYAILGEAYSRCVLGLKEPKVGVLSVGTEDRKGNELTRAAVKLLKRVPVSFIGNIEGHDLFTDAVDVVVCDGFVGNAVLKASERLAKTITSSLREDLRRSPLRMLGAALCRGAFANLRSRMDYEEYGGAPLLGTNGICIIAHGSSSAKSIRNAIRVSREMVRNRINTRIGDKIGQVDWAGASND